MQFSFSKVKSFTVLYLGSVILIYAVLFWRSIPLIKKGLPDFAIYYCAGTVVREGRADQFYDHATRFPVEDQFADVVPQFRGPLPYTHPPFEALLFVPFSYFPFKVAFVLWDLMNVGVLCATVFLLRPHLPHLRARLGWSLSGMIALAFFPVFYTLLQGQDAILLLFIYALAFKGLEEDHPVTAGGWLALGLFKPHLVVPFVLLLVLQKRYKVLYGFFPVAAALVLLSGLLVKVKAILAYPFYVLQVERELTATLFVPAGMPNLRGLLYVLFGDDVKLDALLWALCIAWFVFAAWKCRALSRSLRARLAFCLASLTTVLVAHHVVTYDLSMLLIPVFLLIDYLLAKDQHSWPAWLASVPLTLFFFPLVTLLLSLQWRLFALMAWLLIISSIGVALELSSMARKAFSAGSKPVI